MHTSSSPFPNSTSPYPRDLRSGGPNLAGAGNFYEVDPAAAARLRAFWQQQAPPVALKRKGAKTMSQPATKDEKIRLTDPDAKAKLTELLVKRKAQAEPEPATVYPTVDPTSLYPAEAITRAKREMTKEDSRARRVHKILTPAVIAIWLDWLDDDISVNWIAQHNGLLPITYETAKRYIDKHRDAAEHLRAQKRQDVAPKDQAETETAVFQTKEEPEAQPDPASEPEIVAEPQPKPEIEPMQTAVEPFKAARPENLPTFFDREYRPQRPGPGDALATLAALVNDQSLRVRGSVKLNLEIEFGE